MAALSGKRVLVYLKRSGSNETVAGAPFMQCVLDYFHAHPRTDIPVHVRLTDNKLILSESSEIDSQRPGVKLKHPSFCPIHHMAGDVTRQLPDDIKQRGIDVGAVVLLHTMDDRVLLTRRAAHMRTFPREDMWRRMNQYLVEAGLRELKEETGLIISPEVCQMDAIREIALWESVFPPKLTRGLPKRHHIVVYLHVPLLPSVTSDLLQPRIALDASEVDASTWLQRSEINAIVQAAEERSVHTHGDAGEHVTSIDPCLPDTGSSLPDKIRCTVVKDHLQCESYLPFAPLLRTADKESEIATERVSTGTKYALEEWLACTRI